MSYVAVENLVKKYGDITAVDHLSFTVSKGEIFGLLGPNGAGKSTTLNIITTLTDFDKGKVTVDGLDIREHKAEIKRLIGMVPQDIAIYDHLNALENVKFFASLYGYGKSDLTRNAMEALEFVGLSDKIKVKPKQMSGGMRRRLNIACGIAHKPKLIVLDEPTVGVDAQSREHILNSIRLLRDRGATVIYTSHYMQEVEQICDSIAIIDKGQLIACGTETELVSMVTDVQTVFIKTKIPINFEKETFEKKIKLMPGVKGISEEDSVIKLDISVEQNNIGHIIQEFINFGLPIISIKSELPSLDTLFLTLTGRELR
ncbi:ABC-2 type transport system ATP-binding protein [Herbinix hemicellulosilytica]|uniref:Putative ABC transporter ATP-binding protein YfiL n=1 Tax=Herbinix hemicellulosilytica TaxID=1564487 RepID=A0A0H5SFZ5_HERHM|nr:ABC transporter ATP-binding protein [Herbinix hemicellulosilytica]RBP60725.1 ABC-2 type transport system ATP-binding protein [Herbinix hemicellulosilytica]CRZ34412.1 putative ABC transporter ATP-binding protein YfiL [Herbinix hemicellulosilytica]